MNQSDVMGIHFTHWARMFQILLTSVDVRPLRNGPHMKSSRFSWERAIVKFPMGRSRPWVEIGWPSNAQNDVDSCLCYSSWWFGSKLGIQNQLKSPEVPQIRSCCDCQLHTSIPPKARYGAIERVLINDCCGLAVCMCFSWTNPWKGWNIRKNVYR